MTAHQIMEWALALAACGLAAILIGVALYFVGFIVDTAIVLWWKR